MRNSNIIQIKNDSIYKNIFINVYGNLKHNEYVTIFKQYIQILTLMLVNNLLL